MATKRTSQKARTGQVCPTEGPQDVPALRQPASEQVESNAGSAAAASLEQPNWWLSRTPWRTIKVAKIATCLRVSRLGARQVLLQREIDEANDKRLGPLLTSVACRACAKPLALAFRKAVPWLPLMLTLSGRIRKRRTSPSRPSGELSEVSESGSHHPSRLSRIARPRIRSMPCQTLDRPRIASSLASAQAHAELLIALWTFQDLDNLAMCVLCFLLLAFRNAALPCLRRIQRSLWLAVGNYKVGGQSDVLLALLELHSYRTWQPALRPGHKIAGSSEESAILR